VAQPRGALTAACHICLGRASALPVRQSP